MEKQQRPITFWVIVSAIIFLAMTALWVFGEEPTGLVLVLSGILWWGSGLALVGLGVVAISRRGKRSREPRAGAQSR